MTKLPQISGRRLVNALKKKGWYIDRTSGSHVIMRHDDRPGMKLVIPLHRQPVTPGTLSNILKKADISVDEIKGLI